MSRKLITKTLAVWAIVALIAVPTTAVGQDMQDMQLFGFADYSDYGRGAQPAEGYFFNFDGLMWAVSTPDITDIGNPNVTREVFYSPTASATQGNTYDTSFIGATVSTGQRYEVGYVRDGRGLLFSAFHLNSQTNNFRTGAFSMTFDDQVWGASGEEHLVGRYTVGGALVDLPVDFGSAEIQNRVRTWGVELMGLCRTHELHKGGFLEFFAGARYLEFNDRFTVNAYGWWVGDDTEDEDTEDEDTDVTLDREGILADSWWRQEAKNHIVGPQVGIRWMKRAGRWWINAEGRFFAGFNTMSAQQKGLLGSELDPTAQELGYPIAMGPSSFTYKSTQNEWSPCVELRAGLDFQWTKNIQLGVGWTGIWIDNVARASNMIDYTLGQSSYMGILANDQDVFMNGVNFSVKINR